MSCTHTLPRVYYMSGGSSLVNVTFVQPPALMAMDSYSAITQPPLGVAYLAAYARQCGHEARMDDAE